MSAPLFRLEPLRAEHDRKLFRCGEEILDRYFQTQATQDIRRRVANCFVAVEAVTGQVVHTRTVCQIMLTILCQIILKVTS